MNDTIIPLPPYYEQITSESVSLGFEMCSDLLTGSLLRTLVSAKPGGEILEIGTGTGLSLAFILDGMDDSSTVTTIDNAEEFQAVARNYFGFDERITFYNGDGNDWLRMNSDAKFDLIFADAWPGKYMMLEETLAMLKPGGIYFIDDMNPQPNWPEGHDQKALALEKFLLQQEKFSVTVFNWSTGIILVTPKSHGLANHI